MPNHQDLAIRKQQSMPHSLTTILDLFNPESSYPAFERLRTHLGIRGILSLTATCKQLYALRQYLWDINRSLSRFVDDPPAFRSELGAVEGIISGSFALQFFEGVFWRKSDLDIFVQGPNSKKLGEYLITHEGYELAKHRLDVTLQGYKKNANIKQVDTYTRPKDTTGYVPKIQIIWTSRLPLFSILKSFYTTCILNIITWNRAYALFPIPTYVSHATHILVKPTSYQWTLLRKYSARGWRTQTTLWPEEEATTPLHSFRSLRRVGDRYTWALHLDLTGVRPASVPTSVIEYSQFGVEEAPIDVISIYSIKVLRFEACTLRYTYTFSNYEWADFLGRRTEHLTYIELKKLDPVLQPKNWKDRLDPDGVSHSLWKLNGKFEKPDEWTSCDESVGAWYDAWEKKLRARA